MKNVKRTFSAQLGQILAGCFIPGEDNLVVLAVSAGVFVVDALESGPVCRYGLPLENHEATKHTEELYGIIL